MLARLAFLESLDLYVHFYSVYPIVLANLAFLASLSPYELLSSVSCLDSDIFREHLTILTIYICVGTSKSGREPISPPVHQVSRLDRRI